MTTIFSSNLLMILVFWYHFKMSRDVINIYEFIDDGHQIKYISFFMFLMPNVDNDGNVSLLNFDVPTLAIIYLLFFII